MPTPEQNTIPEIDPAVRLPESVKKSIEQSKQFYAQPETPAAVTAAVTEQPSPDTSTVAEPPPAAPAPAAASPAPTQDDHTAPPSRAELSQDVWAQRYNAMRGRWEHSQRTIGTLQEQLQEMSNEMVQLQRVVQQPRQQQQQEPPQQLVTSDDEETYGREIIDLVQRVAKQTVAPELQNLKSETERVKLTQDQQRRVELYAELARAIPNWEQVNTDRRFAFWLSKRDIYSGHVRQNLLNEALRAGRTPQVIAFFKGFLQEEAATGNAAGNEQPAPPTQQPRQAAVQLQALASPGKARPASDTTGLPDKPSFTRAQIAAFYRDVRAGVYTGRVAEKDRLEAQIFTAQRENRVS